MTDAVASEPPLSPGAGSRHLIVVAARVVSYVVTRDDLVAGLPDLLALAASGLYDGESAAGDPSLVVDRVSPSPTQDLRLQVNFEMSSALLPAAAGVLADTYLLRALHEWLQGPTAGQFDVATSVAGIVPAGRARPGQPGSTRAYGMGVSMRPTNGRTLLPKLEVRIPHR